MKHEQQKEQPYLAAGDGLAAPESKAAAVDLQRFCSRDDDLREYLRKPWAHKGYLYASNGHICVRIPAPDQAAAVFPHKVAESAAGLFDREHGGHAPLPAFDPAKSCDLCGGTGRTRRAKCPECDGEGEFSHGTHWYDCRECDSEGVVDASDGEGEPCDCGACDGLGARQTFARLAPGIGYDARYLAWIKALPGAMFVIGSSVDNTSGTRPAHFIFDGGEGVLMPMRDR
jgi:hypothetical protein